jgi:hypothetical protein
MQREASLMTSSIGRWPLLSAMTVMLSLFQPHPAAAGFDSLVNALWTSVSDFVDDLIEPLTGPMVQSMTRSPHVTLQTEAHFWQYLSDAGYEIGSIETDVGLIPNIKVTLQIERELTAADYGALSRRLAIDDLREPGLTAVIQRGIVRSLLEVSQSGDMRANKVVIGLFPLPTVAFTLTSAEAASSARSQTSAAAKAIKAKAGAEPPRGPNP